MIYIFYRESIEYMRLTTKSEYSILGLLCIARHQSKGFVKIDDICTTCSLPKKYLESLLSILKKRGYLVARSGKQGGYRLARSAKRISLADIIRLMDGALAPTNSASKHFYYDTPIAREKKVLSVFKDIRDYTSAKLEKLKIADFI